MKTKLPKDVWSIIHRYVHTFYYDKVKRQYREQWLDGPIKWFGGGYGCFAIYSAGFTHSIANYRDLYNWDEPKNNYNVFNMRSFLHPSRSRITGTLPINY